jgi:hypothetical protein
LGNDPKWLLIDETKWCSGGINSIEAHLSNLIYIDGMGAGRKCSAEGGGEDKIISVVDRGMGKHFRIHILWKMFFNTFRDKIPNRKTKCFRGFV